MAYCTTGSYGRSTLEDYVTRMPQRKVMKLFHTSLGIDKCYTEINHTFHFKHLGRKLRKFIATCDLCPKTKQMNRAYKVKDRYHLLESPGDSVRFISTITRKCQVSLHLCYYTFWNYVKIYTFRSPRRRLDSVNC